MSLEAPTTVLAILSVVLVTAPMLVYLTRFSRRYSAILVGIGFMVLAIVLEEVIQLLPLLYILIRSGLSTGTAFAAYVSIERNYTLFISLYLGFAAAISQETMKFLAVKLYGRWESGLAGFGFSLVDLSIFLIPMVGTMPVLFLARNANALAITSVILEAPLSMFFHTGSAAFLKQGSLTGRTIRNFPLVVLAHTYIDGSVDFSDISINLKHASSVLGVYVTWIPGILIAVLFLAYLLKFNYRRE